MEKQQLKKKQSPVSSNGMVKWYIILNFLIGFVIGALGIIYGSFFLQTKYSLFVLGTVSSKPSQTPQCVQNVNSLYDCNLYVDYQVDGKPYIVNIPHFYSYNEIMAGQEINLFVDPQNPQDVTLSRVSSWIGIVLIVFGIIFVLYSIIPLIWMYTTPSEKWQQIL